MVLCTLGESRVVDFADAAIMLANRHWQMANPETGNRKPMQILGNKKP